jgi:hypothetical protein
LHDLLTRVLSLVMAAIGVVMLVTTLVGGGGPLSRGVLLGVLFIAAGLGRFYVQRRARG